MIIMQGEVRKIIDDPYKDKSGKEVMQTILILEPFNQKQNYEIYFNENQIKAGVVDIWNKLRGKTASIAVSLYINHDFKFHKYNASGNGLPIEKLEVLNG